MAKLIDVMKNGQKDLMKHQLPLEIDKNLNMIMDVSEMDVTCERGKVRGKDEKIFLRKYSMLNPEERTAALQVSGKRVLDLASELVPCVGCRRSAERLFHQIKTGPGRHALSPIEITEEGVLLSEEACEKPAAIQICAMFHNHLSSLNNLSTSWNRSKKSSRCTLHSLDAQRYVRPPFGTGWKTLWECMAHFCQQEVATIDIAQLLSTLETYLQKHRFCTECRTKVMKAYSLLVDEPEEHKENGSNSETSTCPSSCEHNHGDHANSDGHCNSGTTVKEKGYMPSLYNGIRRCTPNNHIHIELRTDYILGLMLAAEPELLGNRRERHAKTLEIAQEEVLVCVGLCLYERFHRIQLRLREEQTTCQLLALVAINALSTNFQLAVEMKQGISQLELLFEEFNREDRIEQRRKQRRKLKKQKRKKERKNTAAIPSGDGSDEGEKDDDSDDQKDADDSDDGDDGDEIERDEKDRGGIAIVECLVEEESEKPNADVLSPDSEEIFAITREELLQSKFEEADSCYCSNYENTSSSPSKSKEIHRNKSPSVVAPRVPRRIIPTDAGILFPRSFQPLSTKMSDRSKTSPTNIDASCRPMNDFSNTCSNSSTINKSPSVVPPRVPRRILPTDAEIIYPRAARPLSTKMSDRPKTSPTNIDAGCSSMNDFSNTCSNSSTIRAYSKCNDKDPANDTCQANSDHGNYGSINNAVSSSEKMVGLSCDYYSNVHNDCGYGSADNNSSSGSGESSPDSSEVACSEGFCNHDGSEDCNFDLRQNGNSETRGRTERNFPNYDQLRSRIVSASQSLEQMLSETAVERELSVGRNAHECTIPMDVIQRYKSCMKSINEKREELRRTLRTRFAQLCSSK